ncbi:hypothetical protein THAOC_29905 [Thalassiosira oceanica]|uniref:Uncharacterized protein n=1 Tax=Thalassiosira oceanica TaxID=159749 RepID=K0RQ13_THAOC|nr:hypothetical protein THAOC_29905 [Thalassiosira oceanica]|eukprot:EJK50976.1 hypothetical protein THAOC_29905 [Thalassiosira oceanica]
MLIKQFDGRNRNTKAVKELLSQRLGRASRPMGQRTLHGFTEKCHGRGIGGTALDVAFEGKKTKRKPQQRKKFDAMVKDGKLNGAMQMVEQKSGDPGDDGGGKLYRHDDTDTKTGDPASTSFVASFPILSSRRRVTLHVDPSGLPEDTPPPVYLSEEDILLRAKKLRSAAGMDGVDGGALTRIAMLLANASPHYAMYRALNDARMLAADKEPGVRPLVCGCIWMRLMAGAVIDSGLKVKLVTHVETSSCCALGLEQFSREMAVIGNLRAVTRIFPQSAGWTEGEGTSNADIVEQLLTQSGEMRPDGGGPDDCDEEADADSTGGSRNEPNTGFGVTLVDADNAFNRANLYTCICCLIRWPDVGLPVHGSSSTATAITIQRYVVCPDGPKQASHHHSLEGRRRPGLCPSNANLRNQPYNMPLCEELAEEFLEVLELWFADDEVNVLGSAHLNAQCLAREHRLKYGYYPKPEKSFHVCMEVDEEVAKQEFLSCGLELQFFVSGELLALAVRNGGLGIHKPIDTAERQHATSVSVTLTLIESIMRGEKLDMLAHECQMKDTRKAEQYMLAMDEESFVYQLGQKKPSLNKLVRASNSGTWLWSAQPPPSMMSWDGHAHAPRWQDGGPDRDAEEMSYTLETLWK